jgi:hypothetical protein
MPAKASSLVAYYFADPRVVLVPIEHLSPTGVSPAFADAVHARRGWSRARIDLLNGAFTRYWHRTSDLAARVAGWAPPRLRHIAVLDPPDAVHPYAQLLNASAWTLYSADLDPDRSHPELVAYLLAHGDRMTTTGEVTMAALHNAAWWRERSDAECAAFATAAAASIRPDADAFRALAGALGWLRRPHRDDEPAATALSERWATVARAAVATYEARWRGSDLAAQNALLDWLAGTAPPLLVVAGDGRVLWDPHAAARVAALRAELKRSCGAAVRDVHRDLEVIDRHTRRFLAALRDPGALPAAAAEAEQRGYVFMHHQRRLLAYNLDEPDVDRRNGPALPYARAMLGARAVHEWAHLAVDAGWVPSADPILYARRLDALAVVLDDAVTSAAAVVRRTTAEDLAALVAAERTRSPGSALARVLVRRMPDFQSNLLAQRFLDDAERETYVRQNVRSLRAEYPPARRWRMLVRHLYEYQYLRFSAVADPRTFFLRSTWFDSDVLASGMLDEARFDALSAAVAAICDGYAVDESRFQ